MVGDVNITNVPLSSITSVSRNLLSVLLNSKKVIPSEENLPRDWRGLAHLVNISTEVANSISDSANKTEKVLDIWIQKNDGTATVGHLLDFLQRIDRFDIYDDVQDLAKNGQLAVVNSSPQPNNQVDIIVNDNDSHLLTIQDLEYGVPQLYHAYVLYADQDQDFVTEMIERMTALGFRLCTKHDLRSGLVTQYAAVTELISERCRRIILVYSPDFLTSPANSFYMNYTQAVGIELRQLKMLPVMYRKTELPNHLKIYQNLYVAQPGQKPLYDFWDHLAKSLQPTGTHRSNSTNSTHSAIRITEVTQSTDNMSERSIRAESKHALALPNASATNVGGKALQLQAASQATVASTKKPSTMKKILSSLRPKKQKAKNQVVKQTRH